jgi:DNA replication protein DnaC
MHDAYEWVDGKTVPVSGLERARRRFPAKWRDVEPAESAPARSVFLHGTVGTGKTHRAVALALACEAAANFCSVPLWLADTRRSFNGGEQTDDYRDLTASGLLVLDDLGVEKGSEWAQEYIYCLIEAIYEQQTVVLITSNLSLSELSKRLGPRIASRIAEMCDIEEMTGPDRRVETARGKK